MKENCDNSIISDPVTVTIKVADPEIDEERAG